jgi:hypothetical protein
LSLAQIKTEAELVQSAVEQLRQLQGRPDVAEAFALLVAARQLYSVAYARWRELLEAQSEVANLALVEDLLIGAAAYTATKPFTIEQLRDSMQQVVLPALERLTSPDPQPDHLPWPLHMRFHSQQVETFLRRDKLLVLVGYQPLLDYLRQEIVQRIRVHAPQVCIWHLSTSADSSALSLDQWRQVAQSWSRLSEWYAQTERQHGLPDLIWIDDLAQTRPADFAEQPPAATAGHAQKYWHRLMQQQNVACVACLPLPTTEVPDLSGLEYEALRTFTELCPIRVLEQQPDYWRIALGDRTNYWVVDPRKLTP